ncbi:MAG: hypothetical protein WB869_18670 [Candidatus Acidiferrales bacterium]|jgi:hypothetical protein
MNCLEFENVVHDITRNTDVVSPWQRGLDHAQGCERCAVLLAEARAVHASLRTLAVTDGEKQAGPAVEAALRMAFRKNRLVVPASPRWSQWTMGAMLLAGAAAVVLAVVLSFQGSLNNRPQQPFASNDAAQPTAPVPVPGDASGAHAALTAESAKAPAVAEVSAGANPAAAVETANASDGAFTPLPDSDDSLPLDGGAVIRVTMQKSLLASFGLQVSDDDANSTEQIAADVVVDQAGMPRAIRVVQ